MKAVEIRITRNGGIIKPEELPELLEAVGKVILPAEGEAVVIGGRMPIWAYGALVHYYHPSRAVALFDPRLGGAVVVESHVEEYRVGQVIPVALEDFEVVEF